MRIGKWERMERGRNVEGSIIRLVAISACIAALAAIPRSGILSSSSSLHQREAFYNHNSLKKYYSNFAPPIECYMSLLRHKNPSYLLTRRYGFRTSCFGLRGGAEGRFSTADSLSLARLGLSDSPIIPPNLLRVDYHNETTTNGKRVSMRDLYLALLANIGGAGRLEAERMVTSWQARAAPGFVPSLVSIVTEPTADPQVRLMAAIVAKNAIGGFSRERHANPACWRGLTIHEKVRARQALLDLLFKEEHPALCMQVTLCIAYISHHDYPRLWPDAVDDILEKVMVSHSQSDFPSICKALKCLKHVCRMHGSGPEGTSSSSPSARGRMGSAMMKIVQRLMDPDGFNSRSSPRSSLKIAAGKVLDLWRKYLKIFLTDQSSGDSVVMAGVIGNKCLSVLRDMLLMQEASNLIEPLQPLIAEFIRDSQQVMIKIVQQYERILSVLVLILETNPVEFSDHLKQTLEIVLTALYQDSTNGHTMRWKTRKMMFQFVRDVIGSRMYSEQLSAELKQHSEGGEMGMSIDPEALQEARAELEHLQRGARLRKQGADVIKEMLGPEDDIRVADDDEEEEEIEPAGVVDPSPQLQKIIEATIVKYISLSGEELQDWKADPELYLASAGRDAPRPEEEGPRGLGHGLIRQLFLRAPRNTATAIHAAFSKLQDLPDKGQPAGVLYLEAVYRVIADLYDERELYTRLPADELYRSALRPLFLPQNEAVGNSNSNFFVGEAKQLANIVLRTRATAVLGTISKRLGDAAFIEAYHLLTSQLGGGGEGAANGGDGPEDTVLSLTTVEGLISMVRHILNLRRRMKHTIEACKDRIGMQQQQQQQNQQQQSVVSSDLDNPFGLTEEDLLLQRSLNDLTQAVAQSIDKKLLLRYKDDDGDDDDGNNSDGSERRRRMLILKQQQTLARCFQSLESLQEPYGIATILDFVSLIIDLLEDKVDNHIGLLDSYIVFFYLTGQRAEKATRDNTGLAGIGLTRVYGALITLLSHLVARMGPAALDNEQLRPVLLSLLGHVLSAKQEDDSEMQYILDDAFALFETMQLAIGERASVELTPLLQHVVLRINPESPSGLGIVDGYLVHRRYDLIEGFLPQIIPILRYSTFELRDRLVAPPPRASTESKKGDGTRGKGKDDPEAMDKEEERPPRGLSSMSVREMVTVCSVLANLIPLLPELLRAMAQLASALSNVQHRLVAPLQTALLLVLSRAIYTRPNLINKLNPRQKPNPQTAELIATLSNLAARVGFDELLGNIFSNAFRRAVGGVEVAVVEVIAGKLEVLLEEGKDNENLTFAVQLSPRRKASGGGNVNGGGGGHRGLDSVKTSREKRHVVFMAIASAVCKGAWNLKESRFIEQRQAVKALLSLGIRVVHEESQFRKDLDALAGVAGDERPGDSSSSSVNGAVAVTSSSPASTALSSPSTAMRVVAGDTLYRQLKRHTLTLIMTTTTTTTVPGTYGGDELVNGAAGPLLSQLAKHLLSNLGWSETQACDMLGWSGTRREQQLARILRGEDLSKKTASPHTTSSASFFGMGDSDDASAVDVGGHPAAHPLFSMLGGGLTPMVFRPSGGFFP
eukprot:jgi/Bigna1/69309/fgenesh1_pg.8_\